MKRKGITPLKILAYVVLTIGSIAMIFPFLWMMLSAFKDAREIFQFGFWPKSWSLVNFRTVLFDTDFPRWFFNSLVVAVSTTASVLFFCSLVGYTLAKMRFPGKNVIFVLILSTLMVPTEMLVIPWFVMSADYGWVSTFWGIAFPGLLTGFGVFLMRQFFETLPTDLFDAARIDGMNEFGLFWRIGMPLVRPSLAALGIFAFIGNWNAFIWPSGEAGTAWHLIMAASAMAIIPILIVFAIFQRQIIEGVVLTGTKG